MFLLACVGILSQSDAGDDTGSPLPLQTHTGMERTVNRRCQPESKEVTNADWKAVYYGASAEKRANSKRQRERRGAAEEQTEVPPDCGTLLGHLSGSI